MSVPPTVLRQEGNGVDSVFVAPAGWSWDIILYFFLGGLAGGSLFLANLLRLSGAQPTLVPARIGYYLAFPLVNLCALLLVKDLGRPERFWHMLIQSERVPLPMLKWWSPISVGSWVLALFGLFAAISFVYALMEGGVVRWHRTDRVRGWLAPLHRPGLLGALYLIAGAGLGLLMAGYTGLLLNNTSAPTWSQDPLLAPMFMASGVASAGAAIFLLGHFAGADLPAARHAVLRVALVALIVEAVLLVGAILMGLAHVSTSTYFLGVWGLLFWLVILPLGIVAPIVLLWSAEHRDRLLVRSAHVVAAGLLLGGALLFRTLEVLGGQAYFRLY
jgi:protein NrfD